MFLRFHVFNVLGTFGSKRKLSAWSHCIPWSFIVHQLFMIHSDVWQYDTFLLSLNVWMNILCCLKTNFYLVLLGRYKLQIILKGCLQKFALDSFWSSEKTCVLLLYWMLISCKMISSNRTPIQLCWFFTSIYYYFPLIVCWWI